MKRKPNHWDIVYKPNKSHWGEDLVTIIAIVLVIMAMDTLFGR